MGPSNAQKKKGKPRRRTSAGPGKKSGKVRREASVQALAGIEPLDDSQEELELGIDGKPKHRFYNEELEQKTKAIQDQFADLYRQLEV